MSQLLLKKAVTGIVFAVSFSFAMQVSAASYKFEVDDPTSSIYAGKITSFTSIYDDENQKLSFSSKIERNDYGHLANGFWLVLSGGKNPKKNGNEYAIFYGDSISGKLTSYVYNGKNSPNSWKKQKFLQSFDLDSKSETDNIEFSFDDIDVSEINASIKSDSWDGASFGKEIGIWFHPVVFKKDPTYEYDDYGPLTSFKIKKSGWYDTSYETTHSVPAPTTTLLVAAGLLGFVGSKRRKA